MGANIYSGMGWLMDFYEVYYSTPFNLLSRVGICANLNEVESFIKRTVPKHEKVKIAEFEGLLHIAVQTDGVTLYYYGIPQKTSSQLAELQPKIERDVFFNTVNELD